MPPATERPESCEAVVIGGGFYGVSIALYLVLRRGLRQVVLLERESALLTRASRKNQARVHSGYHYPRSFTTAYRSRISAPRFAQDWAEAISPSPPAVYAIAREQSRVTARQFVRSCRAVGARLEPASLGTRRLFEPRLIEDVFEVEEQIFDANVLARLSEERLALAGIPVRFETTAKTITRAAGGGLNLVVSDSAGATQTLRTPLVFNCTYSALNQLGGGGAVTRAQLKHELAEIALVTVTPALQRLSVTVMDGPFFSLTPFAASGLHALSHVRYTPHEHWLDQAGADPDDHLRRSSRVSRADRMIRSAARYVTAIRDVTYVDSMFEVKTVLVKTENDDARPIVLDKHDALPGCYSVLGGKIDNVYDVLEALHEDPLDPS